MDKEKEILSEITVFNKYAKYIPSEERRESWQEIVDRNVYMHVKRYPDLEETIRWAYRYVYNKRVLPSMRSLQFAGKAADVNPARLYNCSFMAVNDYRAFSEALFLLLSGCGVGISVQDHHVELLPVIQKPNPQRSRRYVVADSIGGWADAVKALMKSYFGMNTSKLEFDFSDIRPKGALLVTSGGQAPGPQPLKEALVKVEGILSSKNDGEKLSPINVLDIFCHLADAVLSGGIRRAALITLFSKENVEMLSAKSGGWWESNPQRGRSNNSVVFEHGKVSRTEFEQIWNYSKASRSGEPGFVWTHNKELGVNPCAEISLKDMQMCNLTEIDVSDIDSQEELNNRAKAASIIGTLQASYTDFYYLRDEWKRNCEKDALLGVSMTGIASMKVFDYDLKEAANVVTLTNAETAKLISINKAARCTAVKPAGTTSLVVGSSSGIHAWHSKFYLRRIRINKTESLYTYLSINHPELLENDFFDSKNTSVITIPQRAPEGAILRTESALELLSRVNTVMQQWITPGYRSGENQHNVSCTVTVKDDEWDIVKNWMWVNRHNYTGLSVLPMDTGTYQQTPFEECSEEEYFKRLESLHSIDLTKVIEVTNNIDFGAAQACGGGSCEIV